MTELLLVPAFVICVFLLGWVIADQLIENGHRRRREQADPADEPGLAG